MKGGRLLAGAGIFMALCRFLPGLSALWQRGFIRPAGRILSALTGSLPFPAAEILAVLFILPTIIGLFRRPWTLRGIALLAAAYAILWYPAYFAQEPFSREVSASELNGLCETLIARLNAADLSFPDAETALTLAGEAAQGTVKAPRYPEWMRALGLSGLYVPFTGEALARTDVSPAALPFTAVHELTHGKGIADEGMTNIAAWQTCQEAGGALAVSADLWALKYAMGQLHAQDEALWQACAASMEPALRETFAGMNGFASLDPRAPSPILALLGLSDSLQNYDALTAWLIDHGGPVNQGVAEEGF